MLSRIDALFPTALGSEPKNTMVDEVSRELFERAQRVIPGGVNSPVRAFRAVGGNPIFVKHAKGSRITGADEREYVDYVGSWGPMILGHAHPKVVRAVCDAMERGSSYGAPTEGEVLLAEEIRSRVPSMEMVRLVSSGTEAVMGAIRVARGFTKRDLVVKMEGCYHGGADYLLTKAGSGLATLGEPDSAGVPAAIAATSLTVPFNDAKALEEVFAKRGAEIACVILEPVVGNMGCVPPEQGYLARVCEIARRAGALVIFDEVMTGFRLSRGGAQELFDVRPDLTTLGKVVGGGLPLAAYGGRQDIMSLIAPLGPVYQAGTLSGNPLAVAAGRATLELLDNAAYARLEAISASLERAMLDAIKVARAPVRVQRTGSMITAFFSKDSVQSWSEAKQSSTELFAVFHRELLANKIYWPPSQFEAAFVSLAHSEDDIAATRRAMDKALHTVGAR